MAAPPVAEVTGANAVVRADALALSDVIEHLVDQFLLELPQSGQAVAVNL